MPTPPAAILEPSPTGARPVSSAAVTDGAMGAVIDVITELDRLASSLLAARAVAIDELHSLALAANAPTASGDAWSAQRLAHRVASTELAAAVRISEREAEQLVVDSSALVHDLPLTLGALREGRLSYRHASILADEVRSLPRESWHSFESAALPQAETRSPAGFRQCARALRERQHPSSVEERRREAECSRSVRLEPARDGMAWLTALLPAEQAIGAFRRLTEIAAGLEDDRGARGCDGSTDVDGERRTLAQRRADVFADLLIDGVVPDSGVGRGVRATVLVSVPVITLLDRDARATLPATLEGYGPISGEVARGLAGHAPSFTRLLTHPETGTVLSVGRERYAVPRDLRLWLRLRDETCRFPGCGRAAATSDIDHTIDWQHDGETRHDNLAHLCTSHHQLKHRSAWRVSQVGGGTLEWRSPSGHRYRTEPALRLAG
ncbi:HNH endonuclease signature motif containing protein [Microcella alkalica]|uniref:HNH nuclease domain-containing protein n=1 Tax=Microcella alkalica TaxID=355930 RepID=A0A839EB35_9MICO|nr:HNH endonuclease signature motif containing protein [Microcella alkalica]MBA8848436.1 hypothetical protein [Microcella alkalica]